MMIKRLKLIAQWAWQHWHLILLGIGAVIGLSVYLRWVYVTVGFLQWSGFQDKTLWDILELVIIPLVLAVGGYLLNQAQRTSESQIADKRIVNERKIAEDRLQESGLQLYLDRMTELLLDKGLLNSNKAGSTEVRSVGRTRTLSVLRGLDGKRKGIVLLFLYEADLITTNNQIINLEGADLSRAALRNATLTNVHLRKVDLNKADLNLATLEKADLSDADLFETNLSFAKLNGSNLSKARLIKANLSGADLSGADLSGANLHGADLRLTILNRTNLGTATITREQVATAKSADGAILPDKLEGN